ncbi:MAG: NAD(P)H-hydrate dehydratase [Bacilli bacterium]|uniref:NAD(P)H-hydrate dehydratase n=1 Tax=Ureibacillus sp. FSL K6-3587 TaxID=2954681 RepID=UPI001EBF78F7|nr:bifunctional ADP-dependent NAD(P)H-hydrate dehydratase/NAD(P)H-hydrate epimerase [Bacilli bacterium]
MYVADQKSMQIMDRYTMEQLGLPGVVLMENAGNAVVQEILRDYPNYTRVLVLSGQGNNGGDGFVIARRLIDFGYDVSLCFIGNEEKLKGDAHIHYQVYQNRRLPLYVYRAGEEDIFFHIQSADVIVDAMLGTGVSGEVRSPFYEIIQAVNESHKDVISVDVPSGLNSNTGEVANIAIKAKKTITFALPKIGFFVGDGPKVIGEWKVADISVPDSIVEILQLPLPKLLDAETAKTSLPKRVKHGHKGTFGHCLIIGGSKYYVGAPIYTAKAAFHSGIGLVTLAIPETIYSQVAGTCHESLFLPLPDTNGSIDCKALENIDYSKFKTIVFGPGLGRECDGDAMIQILLEKLTTQTLIVDADGLYFLKNHLNQLQHYSGDIIATPHPGEMATLTGKTVAEVEAGRLETAKHLASTYGIYLLLKGHRPIIATPKGELWINPHGNDALGKGGSGDVLTGLIASLVSQQKDPLKAMLSASYYHATAAEELGKETSNYGVTPMDIIHAIPVLFGRT